MIRISKPDLGREEAEAVQKVMESGQLAQGPKVAEFEKKFSGFIGTEHGIAASNGTTALHMALLANGIGPGDEVLTTSFTFISPVNCILFCRAKPVFVDIGEDFNMDPSALEKAITPKTKAVIPTHLYGQTADMKAIMEIVEKHGLVLVEDACQAHGAEFGGKKAGSFGTGCFSFYATKNMTTGEGGMVTTNDGELAEKIRILRQHGMSKRYHHYTTGYNYRMTDMEAAIGLVQLSKLEEFTRKRIENAKFLTERLKDNPRLKVPEVFPNRKHVFHAYTLRADSNRDSVVEELNKKGIQSIVYYPIPVHEQEVYKGMGFNPSLPNTDKIAKEIFSIPVHPALTKEELEKVADAVNEVVK